MLKLYILLKFSIMGFAKCFGNNGGFSDPQCQGFIKLLGIIFLILIIVGLIITLFEKYDKKNNKKNKN